MFDELVCRFTSTVGGGGGWQNMGELGLGTATQRLRGFIPFHDAGLCNSEPALLLCLVGGGGGH